MSARRHDDPDDAGPFTRRARPVWQVLTLIAAVLAGGSGGLATAKAVARDEAEKVVAPVAAAHKEHIAELVGKRDLMDAIAYRLEASQCANARNTYKLCLAARIECEQVPADCSGGRR